MANCIALFATLLVVKYSECVPLKYVDCKGNNTEELLSVVVLFRHGDRAPIASFPTDAYFDERFWPMGYGQLTKKGKARLYQLGKWLRSRYRNFLPQKYSPKDIYVRSTNTDRCLMSANAALAGLYPPGDYERFNPDLPWQPIPVHTESPRNDEVLSMRKHCKRYSDQLQRAMQGEFFKNLFILYSDFLGYVSEHAGFNNISMDDIRVLETVLEIYASYNTSYLPFWSKHLPKKTLQHLAGIAHGRYTINLELQRLLTGPFWSNLIAHFDDTTNGVSTPKVVMLSAHDTTIVSLLNSMGVYDLVPPIFGATVLWELKKKSGEIYLHVTYKRSGPEAEALAVKGCGIDCSYKRFRDVLEPVTVDSEAWERECGNADNYGGSRGTRKKLESNAAMKNKKPKPFFID